MPRETDTKDELRKYILGDINSEEDSTVIEEKLMTSDEFFQDFLIEEDELIQDYVDGHLSLSEIKSFEQNYLISNERKEKINFAKAFRKAISEDTEFADNIEKPKKNETGFWQWLFAHPIPIFVGALAIVSFSLIGWFLYSRAANNEVIASLNKAYSKERPFESRITDLEYAQPRPVTRGNDSGKVDKTEFENARNIALRAVSNSPTAENIHTLGRVYLSERNFDEAIVQFNKAVQLSPNNAKFHTDLGTAWSEKGKSATEKRIESFGNAIEQFDRAIALDQSLAEAYFNKALCLQLMKAPNQAKEAWKEYLKLDSNSKWAEEAKRNLQTLESQDTSFKTKDEMLQEFLTVYRLDQKEESWLMLRRNREMSTGKLIPQQLAFSFSATKQKEFLKALIYAGEIEFQKTGDAFWKNLGAFYQNLSESQLIPLNEAHNLMSQAYEFCQQGKNEDAFFKFEAARKIFDANRNVLESSIATFWVGFCEYVKTNLDQSKKELQILAEYCKKNNYRWLLSHAIFWIGVNYGSEKQNSKAIEYYQTALQVSESVFDSYNSQKILTETAEEYRLVGRAKLALDYLEKSLELSDYAESSLRQKSRTYDNLVRAFYSLRAYQTALVYEKENILLLDKIKDIAFHQSSNLQLGQILTAQKKYGEALAVFEESKKNAEAIVGNGQQKDTIADSVIQIAHLQREIGNYEKAILNYTDVINYYHLSDSKASLYDAHKGRLFCYLELNDTPNFDKELHTVLDLFESNRTNILDEQTRNIFFNNEQNVYDLAIDYEFGKGNKEKAFDYSEKSRSRSLLDLVKNGAKVKGMESNLEVILKNVSEPLELSEFRRQIPDKVQLIQYAVLHDKVLIWLVSKDDFQVFSSPIQSKELEEKVDLYLKLVSSNDDSITNERNSLSAELYRILISPVIETTRSDKEICLIPDKILSQLPFASLLSPNKQFLIQERSLFYAPSANVFLVFTKNAERLGKKSDETILSIGNPAFNQKEFPNLENLEPAETEAKEISGFYQNPKTFLTKDALKQNIKSELANKDVIHFAGHYVVNETSPLNSSFILAANNQANDSLSNYELIGEDLSQTRLVVLSACRTNAENYYHGEGMIGASRTFLAAGIPLVVASQWSVETKATAELMIKFHKYRKGGNLSTNNALRQAQLDLINGQNESYKNPYYWSAFITLGGYAEF